MDIKLPDTSLFDSFPELVPASISRERKGINVINVSTQTGKKIKGKVVYWKTRSGDHFVDHIAAMSISNDLLVFWKSQLNSDWNVVNVSQKTGKKIAGNITAWQTTNGYNRELLAARGADNHLLVFGWASNHDWEVIDVTLKTNKIIAGNPSAWVTPDGMEHVTVRASDNSLLVFHHSMQRDWHVTDVSAKTNRKVSGDPTTWLTKSDIYNVSHIGIRETDNDLLVFWWSERKDWQCVNVSQKTGKKVSSDPCSWLSKHGDVNIENMAAKGIDNKFYAFQWTSSFDWLPRDVTQVTGPKVDGCPADYQVKEEDHTSELVVSRSLDGELILFWLNPKLDWQMMNLTDITLQRLISDPACWTMEQFGITTEFIAGEGNANDLMLLVLQGRERLTTDEIHRPVETFSRQRYVRRKVLVILWDPHFPEVTSRPSPEEVDRMIFGETDSVREYFLENSNGFFTIEKAGVVGWYEADRTLVEYWPPQNPDGPKIGGHDSGREAIMKATADFDFKAFDKDNDNNLERHELAIVFFMPGNRTGGMNRTVGEDFTIRETAAGIRINGLYIGTIIEARVSPIHNPNNIGITAHELSHLLLGHGDMYFDAPVWTAAGGYSLMDQHNPAPHIDPFGKLKFGWLKPEVIFRSGRYRLENVEKSQRVYLLIHPDKGMDEYYIIENRCKNMKYGRRMEYQGLAVWHITEKRSLYQNSIPPKHVTEQEWAEPRHRGLTRHGIRLIKPCPTRDINNRKLWDGTYPDLSYPLTSDNSNPNRSALIWSDGSPSGFTIKNFSPAGEVMEFDVVLPSNGLHVVVPIGR